MEENIAGVGQLAGDLSRINNKVATVGKRIAGHEKNAEPAQDELDVEQPPLVFESEKKALEYISVMTNTREMVSIENNGVKKSNLGLHTGVAQLNDELLSDDITSGLRDINEKALSLSIGVEEVTPESLKPIRESLDKLKVRLNYVNSEAGNSAKGADGQPLYNENDRLGVNKILEQLKTVEEIFDGVESKKYGMIPPEQSQFAGMVPDGLSGVSLAASDVIDAPSSSNLSISLPSGGVAKI